MEWHTDCELVANSCPMAALVIFFDQAAGKADNPFLTSLFDAFDDRGTSDDDADKKSVDLNMLMSGLDFSKMWLYEDGS